MNVTEGGQERGATRSKGRPRAGLWEAASRPGHSRTAGATSLERTEGIRVALPSPLPMPALRSQAALGSDLETGPLCRRDPNRRAGRLSLPIPGARSVLLTRKGFASVRFSSSTLKTTDVLKSVSSCFNAVPPSGGGLMVKGRPA